MRETSPNTTEVLRTLGKYALIEKLGEGHLGPVFRGFDQDLGKAVVVRILSEDIKWGANIEHFFSQLCKTVAGLEHPNIVSIVDFGKEAQSPYVVMESLGSGNLKALINKKPDMSVEAKLSIMIQVAEGLSYAHKKTILHRDLKPDKIHLVSDGGVKIRDFAMAHILMRHLPRRIVHWREPIYLSPEQIQKKESDERADIFSAGMIFYELLTYIHPFHDSNNNRTMDSDSLNDSIPTFEQFPDVPPGFWPILKTCMAADPEDRYKSMDDLLTACKDLRKSLAEDTQLMLAELYASQNALKKAAAQPDASESTRELLRDIQELSRGDKKPDCVTLDRMTTALIEHYPIIQATADVPDTLDPQPDFEIPETEVVAQDSSDTESIPLEETIEEKEIPDASAKDLEKPEPELQHSSIASGVEPDRDLPHAPILIEDADNQPNAIQQDSSEVHSFDLDHRHGLFGGSCRGVLLMGCQSIEYNPFSGQHGFRVPLKLLKISRIDRKSVKLSFVSDNKHFESFKFQDDNSAERFYQVWDNLKTVQQ
jgi:serine/threonine protein kinase